MGKRKYEISDKVKIMSPKMKFSNKELLNMIKFQSAYLHELERIIFEPEVVKKEFK